MASAESFKAGESPNYPHSAGFAGTRPGGIDRLENKQPERVLTLQELVKEAAKRKGVGD